jgi:hypothetical protein
MPDGHRAGPAPTAALPAGALIVPTPAARQPDDGDPELLAWRGPDGGQLLAVAWSSPAALDQALPGGQPWVALVPAELHAALAVHGPYRLLVDPDPTVLAGLAYSAPPPPSPGQAR